MTKPEWIKTAEECKEHSLTKRWNLLIQEPGDYGSVEHCMFCEKLPCIQSIADEEKAIGIGLCPCLDNTWIKDEEDPNSETESSQACCGGLFDIYFFNRNSTTAQAIYDFIDALDIEAIADEWEEEGRFEMLSKAQQVQKGE